MVFTSVSGHLMEKDFEAPYRKNWQACAPGDLFHLPVVSYVPDKMKNIFQTLQAEAKKCQWLVLWLDCDREGENIAFEVIEACRRFVFLFYFFALFFRPQIDFVFQVRSPLSKSSGLVFQRLFMQIFKELSTIS